MSPLIGKDDSREIEKLLRASLVGEVRIFLFTQKGRPYVAETKQLLEEIQSFSSRIKLEVLDIDREPKRAQALEVDSAPTTVVVAANGALLHFVGMPAGRQLRPLVEDIVDASRGHSDLDDSARGFVKRVGRPTKIKVFVTPTCLYSPFVVRSAHKFALANPLIRAYMIETLEFPEVAKEYGVVGVPRTVINEEFAFDGSPGERAFAERVLGLSL